MSWTRRGFLGATGLTLGGAVAGRAAGRQDRPANAPAAADRTGKPPIAVASANGLAAVSTAFTRMTMGADPLDAAIAGVNLVELDPLDNSVGYGGLPNERGDVELDASVMHGPTRRAGGVASLRGVRTPSLVAKTVMERTNHILIVGHGAREFATAHGFEDVELLTPESRLAWLAWKETLSSVDNWGPSRYVPEPASPAGTRSAGGEHSSDALRLADQIAAGDSARRAELLAWVDHVIAHPPTGTINCIAVDAAADIGGVTTTSGLAWKLPGRVGDSPIIGCGLYVDNNVGAAGSTGRGEEVIYNNGSRMVVEYMNRGMAPELACLEGLKLVVARYGSSPQKLKDIDVNFYALNKKGEFGAAAIWSHTRGDDGSLERRKFAVADRSGARLLDSAFLFEIEKHV